MPNYSYRCKDCQQESDYIITYDERQAAQVCLQCGGVAEYTFPITSNIWGAMDYHDESLGVDIHGRRHRKQVMKAMNVREAGDVKGGGRNFEKSHATGILPLQGREFSDVQREQEKARKRKESKTITALNKDGSERVYRHGDLSDKVPALKTKHL